MTEILSASECLPEAVWKMETQRSGKVLSIKRALRNWEMAQLEKCLLYAGDLSSDPWPSWCRYTLDECRGYHVHVDRWIPEPHGPVSPIKWVSFGSVGELDLFGYQ